MEEEIDLRQYIDVLIKHYQLIILGTVLAALAALVVSVLFISPTYQATAGVLIAQTRSQVTFDPRFQTVEGDLTARYAAMNQQAHRGALVALVKNGTIAIRVAEQLQGVLNEAEQRPAQLLGMVSGALWETQSGAQQVSNDFIAITVRSGDPAKATQIANAWGQVYEEFVNEVYHNRPESYTSVQEQVVEAKATCEQAEDALTTFVATNRLDELGRLITERQHIIDSLQSARQTAMTTMINEEVKAYSQIIAAYVSAQTQNQLIAFEKEQDGNRALLSSYLDAYYQGRQAVFDEQVKNRVQILSNHYATKRKMERLLQDARALYAQIQAGGADGTATNSLSILMLKAEVFSASAALPGELQLQLDTVGGLDAGAIAQRADVEALIGVIENRIAELEQTIETESLAQLDNEGYEYLSHSVPLSDTLSTAIQEQYSALFDLGDLAALTESISPDNPLASAVAERSEALLQFKELETLAYDVAAAPLTRVIDELGEELQSLQAELAEERAAERELTRARDLAWETYSTLELKADELSISMGMKDVEVRFASPAVEPIKPIGRNKLLNIIVAAVLGFVLSSGAVFVIHYVNPEYDPWRGITTFLTRKK